MSTNSLDSSGIKQLQQQQDDEEEVALFVITWWDDDLWEWSQCHIHEFWPPR